MILEQDARRSGFTLVEALDSVSDRQLVDKAHAARGWMIQ
jgi:hypothetical protein